MSDVGKPMSFMAAMRDFFGFKTNQKPLEFGAEIKTLDNNEREYFTKELTKLGYSITPPAA